MKGKVVIHSSRGLTSFILGRGGEADEQKRRYEPGWSSALAP